MSTLVGFSDYMHSTNYLDNDLLGVERHTIDELSSTKVDWPQPAFVDAYTSTKNFLLSRIERKISRGERTAYISSLNSELSKLTLLILDEYQHINAASKELEKFYLYSSDAMHHRLLSPSWQVFSEKIEAAHDLMYVKDLKCKFNSSHWARIDSYIKFNQDLIPLLFKIDELLPDYKEITRWNLACDDDDTESLYLILDNNVDSAEEVCELEAKIFMEVFEDFSSENQGRIVLSLV